MSTTDVSKAGQPTQVAHPRRTTWRTFVWAAIVLVPSFAAALPEVLETLADTDVLPEGFRVWAAGAAVVVAGVIGLVNRLALIPGVNDLLERWKRLRLGTGVETEPVPTPAPSPVDYAVVDTIDPSKITAGTVRVVDDAPSGEVPPASTYGDLRGE